MNFKSPRRRAMLALILGLAMAGAANAEHPVPADVVPAGSLGYIHLYPQALRSTPTLAMLDRLLLHVETEASLLSMTRLGLDLTELENVTIVVAPIEQLMNANGSLPCVVVATVSKSFRPNTLGQRLPSTWREVTEGDQILFENPNGNSLHVFSNTTVVLGPTESVKWWMNTAGEEGQATLATLLSNSYESGHVLMGADLREVPKEALNSLPPIASPFGNAKFASLDLYLGAQLEAAAYLHFGHDNAARVAGDQLRKLKQQGAGLLTMSEAQMAAAVKDAHVAPEHAMGSLMALALAREGAEMLENTQIKVDGVDLMAKISVDHSFVSIVGVCLASIQAVGTNAAAKFEDIADEIGEPTP